MARILKDTIDNRTNNNDTIGNMFVTQRNTIKSVGHTTASKAASYLNGSPHSHVNI